MPGFCSLRCSLVVLGLTILWWTCAILVTVVIKAALGGSTKHDYVYVFPFPMTITFLTNVSTAILTALLAMVGCGRRQQTLESSQPVDAVKHGVLLRAPSREALLHDAVKDRGLSTSFDSADSAGTSGVSDMISVVSNDEACAGAGGDMSNTGKPTSGQSSASQSQVSSQLPALLFIGFLQGLSLAAKNEALLLLSVSTRSMVFSLNVLVVMLVAQAFGVEALRKTKLLAAGFLALGGCLQAVSTWQHITKDKRESDHLSGLLLAIIALFLDALRWVLLQALFMEQRPVKDASAAENMTPAVLIRQRSPFPASASSQQQSLPLMPRYLASIVGHGCIGKAEATPSKFHMVSCSMFATLPICLGLSLMFEPVALVQATGNLVAVSQTILVLSLGVTGICMAEFGVVQWTSAVTFNVLAQLHGIPLVLAGVILFGEEVGPFKILGFVSCLAGALLYGFLKSREEGRAETDSGSERPQLLVEDKSLDVDLDAAKQVEEGQASSAEDVIQTAAPMATTAPM